MDTTLKQIGAAALTVIVYAFLFGWQVSLILTVAVAFHEMSHIMAARKLGMKTGGFYLMPFVGGIAFIEGTYSSYTKQAIIVLAGPIGGGLLALVTTGLYLLTGSHFFLVAAVVMLYLNVFNLLPLSFLDGGQVMSTITYSINRTLGMVCFVGSTVIAIGLLCFLNPAVAAFVALLGGVGAYREIRNWRHFRAGRYQLVDDHYLEPPKKLSVWQMALTIGVWIGTAVILLSTLYFLQGQPDSGLETLLVK